MLKRNSLRKYFTLILMFFTVVIGFSSWIIVGEKNVTLGEAPVTKAVCYYTDSNGNKKEYTRIEKALEDVNNSSTGGIVYVYPGVSAKIYKDCTIGNNVSLILPYEGTTYMNRLGTGNVADFSDSGDYNKLVTSVVICENVTVTMLSNSKLIIGGILGNESDGLSGQTSGLYTQIVLSDFAKIHIPVNSNGALIDCYGYIKESKQNNQSQVIAETGIINIPFVVYDYRGGQNTVAVYSGSSSVDPVCPFSVYDMPNIQTNFIIYYKTYLYGYVDLYTGALSAGGGMVNISAQHNIEKTCVISPTTNSLITLEQEAYVNIKYTSFSEKYTKVDVGSTSMEFYGGAQLNSLVLKISVIGISATISTSTVFFPINWKFTIKLNEGEYSFNSPIKIMTGASIYVEEDATLYVQDDLIIYDEFTDKSYQNIMYPNKPSGLLFVNGVLNVSSAANVGGIIYTTKEGARLINSSLSIKVKSVECNGKLDTGNYLGLLGAMSSKDFSGVTIIDVADTIELDIRGNINSTNNLDLFNATSVYDSNGSYWSINNNINKYYISFNSNGGTTITNQTQVFVPGDSVEIPSNINRSYIPVKEGYKFLGWYLDSNLSNSAPGTILNVANEETITLYAKWEKDLTQITKVEIIAEATEFDSSGTTTAEVKCYNIDNQEIEPTSIVWSESDANNVMEYSETDNQAIVNVTINVFKDKDYEATLIVNVTDVNGRNKEGSVTFKSNGSCLLPGTLVTMADGTKKPVEQIQPGDMLKVFNHYTGEYDVSPVVFNDSEPKQDVKVINLEFSNGSNIGVVYEHGFFDLDLMKYVYIDEYNYNDYIGHRFYSDGNNIVTLNRAYITTQYTEVYSPVTAYHLNYFTEDILSMPGGIEGLFNTFEYDDDLKYNEELMKQDIEKYGLYTYEDFKDYCSYEFYQAFPAEYLKVAVGKAYITFDEIIYLINRYKNKV